MTSKKPDRNVSKMDVLKDIRGLLSSSQEKESLKEVRSEDKVEVRAEIAGIKEDVKRYKALVQKQLDEIDKLKSESKGLVQKHREEMDGLRSENKELIAKLDTLTSSKVKPVSTGSDKSSQAMADIEARTSELNLALSQVEGLLQLKTKELMGRLARVYQEAAQGEIALEFRKGRDELESLENLAHFVQALLGE